jgi:hypothetical protein
VKIKFWVSSAMCLQRKGCPANCYKWRENIMSVYCWGILAMIKPSRMVV